VEHGCGKLPAEFAIGDTCPMLYVHCGWPHTGTTSFQAAMFARRERFVGAGIVYPDRWQRKNAHHGILELCEPSTATRAAVKGFQEYLEANRDRTVLISSEQLTAGLKGVPPAERRGSLLRLLAVARQVTPVTCLWTLRRLDDLVVALYNSAFMTKRSADPPLDRAQWAAAPRFSSWPARFAGMREVEDVLGGAMIYARYDAEGAHYDELLRAAGMPDSLRREILKELRDGARLNARVTQKAAATLLHLHAISRRAGIEIPRTAVLKAWFGGELRFAEDSPCELVDPEVRRVAHEEALKACRAVRFDPYLEFFEQAEPSPAASTPLNPEILNEADLERLVALVR
jgi:hypothetical protein